METSLTVEQKSHLGRIAAKQFLTITDLWKVTDSERRILAGAATRTTISTWRKRVKTLDELQLGNDTYERLICIADIHQALLRQFKKAELHKAIRDIKLPFTQHSLLETMLNGWVINLYQVKNFLENDALASTEGKINHPLPWLHYNNHYHTTSQPPTTR